MVICVEVGRDTKEKMDRLVAEGKYSGYSELVAISIENQYLLHGSTEHGRIAVIPEIARTRPNLVPSEGPSAVAAEVTLTQPDVPLQIPSLFRAIQGPRTSDFQAAPLPNDVFVTGMVVPVERWIFGQYNKLLPLKANVRALANLLSLDAKASGIELDRAGTEIASAAVNLGDLLRKDDSQRDRQRDDAFSVGFPTSSSRNSEKSKLRYAEQFVGSWINNGRATGLLIDFKFINVDKSKPPRVRLTQPGLQFSLLPNPVLDEEPVGSGEKFSPEESEFLVAHIASSLPVEKFAFSVTLDAISSGADTPDGLDKVLKQHLTDRLDKPFTDAFLTTQRAGVISRMSDLGLVSRVRNGLRVTYVVTDRGIQFLKRG